MGLLDLVQITPDMLKSRTEEMAAFLQSFMADPETAPEFRKAAERLLAGETYGSMHGLERKHRDAVIAQGFKYLQLNRLDEAFDWLSFAVAIDPLEERAFYGLGVIAQMRGQLTTAVRAFMMFQALDATNPEGILRLGECLFANREFDDAANCFRSVLTMVDAGYGEPRHREHAERMIAIVEEAAASAGVETA